MLRSQFHGRHRKRQQKDRYIPAVYFLLSGTEGSGSKGREEA
ncbi:MAG: hypothetical protein OCU24_02245 [Candidatus Methanospirare jalkutatii]|nr:hypothetical protein [Candidatus Methanospirare jalkutatii]